jgi:predicted metal-dependent hydrolase
MMSFLSGAKRRLPEQDCLELADAAIPYRIRESARRRTLALELRADGALTVAAPAGLALPVIRRFVASRRAWIESKRALLAARAVPPVVLVHGARLPFLGAELELHLDAAPGARASCRRDDAALIVRAATPVAVRAVLERWYRSAATGHFAERIAHFAPRVGAAPQRLAVRAARTRWGSCSRRGTVSLNWRLMQAAPGIPDYVVVHELCHLLVPNHSPRFWAEVARVLPDYRERRQALHAFGRQLAF